MIQRTHGVVGQMRIFIHSECVVMILSIRHHALIAIYRVKQSKVILSKYILYTTQNNIRTKLLFLFAGCLLEYI